MLHYLKGLLQISFCSLQKGIRYRMQIFFFFFCVGRMPDPTSHFPPDLILYVNLVAMVDNLSVLRPGSPSITVLVLPDFAASYTVDLHNFRAKYQRFFSFWVPVNYPSLNELVSIPELQCIPTQFRLPPNLCLCKLP
jgi:hypothetical protein